MTTVTPELETLEEAMAVLLAQRKFAVANARELIRMGERDLQDANETFDRLAVPIGKRINELRGIQEPKRNAREPNLEGLTDQEREHYMRLRNATH